MNESLALSESPALSNVEWVEDSADATERVPPWRWWRTLSCFFAIFLALGNFVFSQEPSTPQSSASPSPVARNVRVSFVPPPLEGRISLGIYDANEKLVRVLHRESAIESFTIGHDALSTTWDGKDNGGANVPPGKYNARGYVTGKLRAERVAHFFNDWITDERSPRIERVQNLSVNPAGELIVLAVTKSGRHELLRFDSAGNPAQRNPLMRGDLDAVGIETNLDLSDLFSPAKLHVRIESGKLSFLHEEKWHAADWPNLFQPEAAAFGKERTLWAVDHLEPSSANTGVKQFSLSGELLRRLLFAPVEPQPKAIAPSTTEDKIYLLEENAVVQRVRGLTLPASKKEDSQAESTTDWKVIFEKAITAHKMFSLVDGRPELVAAGHDAPPEKVSLRLQSNPLTNDEQPRLDISASFDARGSFLQTIDGLPLLTVTQTPELERVLVTSRAEKTLDLFQDDGAVVEQIRIIGADEMMAFDCGGFELK